MTHTEGEQVAELMTMLEDLSPWEQQFVQSLAHRPQEYGLTPAQGDKLDELVAVHIKGDDA